MLVRLKAAWELACQVFRTQLETPDSFGRLCKERRHQKTQTLNGAQLWKLIEAQRTAWRWWGGRESRTASDSKRNWSWGTTTCGRFARLYLTFRTITSKGNLWDLCFVYDRCQMVVIFACTGTADCTNAGDLSDSVQGIWWAERWGTRWPLGACINEHLTVTYEQQSPKTKQRQKRSSQW